MSASTEHMTHFSNECPTRSQARATTLGKIELGHTYWHDVVSFGQYWTIRLQNAYQGKGTPPLIQRPMTSSLADMAQKTTLPTIQS